MVYFGKILYFKDVMIPFKTDEEKIGYTKEQLAWALENESNIWEFFVERELLFETDPKLSGRFINPAPFTKFNLELDAESPGRLGQYIGWQIVNPWTTNFAVDIDNANFTRITINRITRTNDNVEVGLTSNQPVVINFNDNGFIWLAQFAFIFLHLRIRHRALTRVAGIGGVGSVGA